MGKMPAIQRPATREKHGRDARATNRRQDAHGTRMPAIRVFGPGRPRENARMYAIIEDGGKQYKVQPGDVLAVELRSVAQDSTHIEFDKVLLPG